MTVVLTYYEMFALATTLCATRDLLSSASGRNIPIRLGSAPIFTAPYTSFLPRRSAPTSTLRLTLRGGGLADELQLPDDDQLQLPDDDPFARSWKRLVNETTTVPYSIMASPLTPLEEYQRLTHLENEALPLSRLAANATTADGRPIAGPDGAYGPPDSTGRRWKELRAGEELYPYPRVPLRYYLNESLAQRDPYLRFLRRANISSQESLFVDDFDADEDVHGDLVHIGAQLRRCRWRPTAPNITLGPSPQAPYGHVLTAAAVSRNWRPQDCDLHISCTSPFTS
jgi:hypothetical protein